MERYFYRGLNDRRRFPSIVPFDSFLTNSLSPFRRRAGVVGAGFRGRPLRILGGCQRAGRNQRRPNTLERRREDQRPDLRPLAQLRGRWYVIRLIQQQVVNRNDSVLENFLIRSKHCTAKATISSLLVFRNRPSSFLSFTSLARKLNFPLGKKLESNRSEYISNISTSNCWQTSFRSPRKR